MSYYSKRKNRARKKTLIGFVGISIVLVAFLALFGAKTYISTTQLKLDPVTMCPFDGSPSYISIIFDKTDRYNQIQRKFLTNYFDKLEENFSVGTKVTLFVVEDQDLLKLEPVASICNPGKEANPLYQNPKMQQKKWREKFKRPLDDAIAGFMSPSIADSSPIFEMIQVASLTGFPSESDDSPKTLIIVSDMLQHVGEYSHYRSKPDFDAFEKSNYYQKIRTDLRGTDVQILYVRRDGAEKFQTKRHAYFWDNYFSSINASVSLIERIDG